MEEENKIDLVEFRGRVSRGLRVYTDLDHYPDENPEIYSQLYQYKLYFLRELKGKESWSELKSYLEDAAYSTIELRKAAVALDKIVKSIRETNKMGSDKSGSSTVFLFNLMAKYPLTNCKVKGLSKLEFGNSPSDCLLYQAKKLVNTMKENLPADVVHKLEGKRDDVGHSETPFGEHIKFVSRTTWSPDMEGISKLSNLDIIYDETEVANL